VADQAHAVVIAYHDSVADDAELDAPDREQFRRGTLVEAFLCEHGFGTRANPTACEPGLRDYVYGMQVDD
jgi:hypothetical protein